MNYGDELRRRRLQQLHSRLLRLAETYPLLWHAAARSDCQEEHFSLVPSFALRFFENAPRYFGEAAQAHDQKRFNRWTLIADFEFPFPISAFADSGEVYYRGHRWVTQFCEMPSRQFSGDYSRELSKVASDAVLQFRTIALELQDEFRDSIQAMFPSLEVRNRVFTNESPWLTAVYGVVNPPLVNTIIPEATVVTWLSSDLFSASARAIEVFARKEESPLAPVLKDSEAAVIEALRAAGRALTGKELAVKLKAVEGCSEGNLTRHVLKKLKELGLVANQPGAGYYLLGE